ncbi:glycosyltransferase family 2 protein [Thermoactinomyces mirandus]|uniref:Glycosyltransferase family 2 protein n=1 Tax=Thermoactinomyces mirandus TaxID=2756294 RepID=A0A7W1XRM8_9BACL|nr:glycosyltransferase [Thermoactinomyces mirandus]MBA4601936.1 glycosyltransferase family 2 protein [Thermoactinomyces mirandus]
MKHPLVSLVIPHKNDWKRLYSCLEGIRQYSGCSHEIILVDNGSPRIPASILRQPHLTVIHNQWDRGTAASLNQGMEKAQGEYIGWLCANALPSHRWLGQLLHVLRQDDSIGMVGPVTNRGYANQKLGVPFKTISKIHRFSNQFNHIDAERWKETEVLSRFCVLFHRKLLHEIGWLDERYGLGSHEHVDYCTRLRNAGYRLMVAGDTYVHQLGKKAVKKEEIRDMIRIRKQNHRYYLRKWFYLHN